MNRFALAGLGLLLSSSAFACPQIAGTYKCDEEDGTSFNITVTQSAKDNVQTFQLNQYVPFAADNQAHPYNVGDSLHDSTMRAWCDDDNTLHTQTLGQQYSDTQYMGKLTFNEDYSLSNGGLHMTSNGQLSGGPQEYPLHGDQVCAKVTP